MLQAAAALPEDEEKLVLLVRKESPESIHLFDVPRQVSRRGVAVPPRDIAGAHHVVPLAGDGELPDAEIAGKNRRVDQRLVIVRAKVIRRPIRRGVQAGHRPPRRRQLEMDIVRTLTGFDHRHEGRRAVQDAVAAVDVVGRHRALVAEDAIRDRDRRLAAGLDAPAILLRLLDGQRRAVPRPRLHVFDLAGVVLDAVVAGRPDRHHQLDRRAAAGRYRRLHLGVMRLRRRHAHRVDDRVAGLRDQRRRRNGDQRGSNRCGRDSKTPRHDDRLYHRDTLLTAWESSASR